MDVSAAASSIRATSRSPARSAAALPDARRGLLDDLLAGAGLESALARLCDGLEAAGGAIALLVGSGDAELAVGDAGLLGALRTGLTTSPAHHRSDGGSLDARRRRCLVAAVPNGVGGALGAVAVRHAVAAGADDGHLGEVAALLGLHLMAAQHLGARQADRDLVLRSGARWPDRWASSGTPERLGGGPGWSGQAACRRPPGVPVVQLQDGRRRARAEVVTPQPAWAPLN